MAKKYSDDMTLYMPQPTNKRKRVETEGTSSFNRTRFSAAKETHYNIDKRVLEGMVVPQGKKKQKMEEVDRFKKMQCSVTLKRLMVHRDGWPFRKSAQGKALEIRGDSDNLSKPLMDLDTIKWKLDKGFYMNTNQFAGYIRIMFSNAMFHYPSMHEIHRIAVKLSELFEVKWKSLKERWAAEKEKAKREEDKPKPLGRVREVSVGVNASQSVTSKGGKGRKLVSDSELSTEQATGIAKPKHHLLDTTLAAPSSLLGCKVGMQRKKEREAARGMLQRTAKG